MSILLNRILSYFLANINFSNVFTYLDLFLASFLVVGFFIYMRRFPSYRVLLGTLFLFICTLFFSFLGFTFTSTVLGFASTVIFISLPLIFSSEIRHYLGKLGRFSFFKLPKITTHQKRSEFVRDLVDAAYELAERSIGGTIVIARKTGLEQTIDTGVILNARFSSKLLQSIFFPKSPLHDGAVVIKDDKLFAALCLLPVHAGVKLDPPFGTRHKSGLSITIDTDAVVIIISEQRGEISLAENGKIYINQDRAQLTEKLQNLL